MLAGDEADSPDGVGGCLEGFDAGLNDDGHTWVE